MTAFDEAAALIKGLARANEYNGETIINEVDHYQAEELLRAIIKAAGEDFEARLEARFEVKRREDAFDALLDLDIQRRRQK